MTVDRNSNWLFHIQLLSFLEDENLLNLLRFPGKPLSIDRPEIEVLYWSRGEPVYQQLKALEDPLDLLAEGQANEIFVVYRAASIQALIDDISLVEINSRLNISSTSSVWASTKDCEVSDGERGHILMIYEAQEVFPESEINRRPTLLQVIVEFQSSQNKDELYQKLLDLLLRSFPDILKDYQLTGCAQLLKKEQKELVRISSDIYSILNQLAPWPKTYPLLDEQFDDLHPILIGPLSRCTSLSNALGNAVTLKTFPLASSEQSLAAIWIPESVLQNPDSATIAAPWLVSKPKNESTALRKPDPKLGEFRVGKAGIVLLTAKRWREVLAHLKHRFRGKRPCHIIQPQYCLMIGINPDEMLVWTLDDELATHLEQEVENCWAELPVEMLLEQKVWLAHKTAWESKCFEGREILSFVKAKFFPNL